VYTHITVYTLGKQKLRRFGWSLAIVIALAVSSPAQPSPIVQRVVELNDAVITYRERGEGPPVVFVHALLLDSRLWLDQLDALCQQRRCFAPDFSGHGFSSPLLQTQVDPQRFAAELNEFMDRVGIKDPAHIVGLSAGGLIATLFCQKHSDRCRSLTLISTTLDGQLDAAGARYRAENARTVVLEGKDTLFRRFNEYIVAPSASLHVRARYRSMLEQTPYETLVAFLTTRSFAIVEPSPALRAIPVMIPVGTGDAVVSVAQARQLSNFFNNTQVVTLESVGRLLPLEAPKELNSALSQFWQSIEGNGK
jgi:3-oxoadipate enol-lactonase